MLDLLHEDSRLFIREHGDPQGLFGVGRVATRGSVGVGRRHCEGLPARRAVVDSLVSLLNVALVAQSLEVGVAVVASFSEGYDMVDSEVLSGAALRVFALIPRSSEDQRPHSRGELLPFSVLKGVGAVLSPLRLLAVLLRHREERLVVPATEGVELEVVVETSKPRVLLAEVVVGPAGEELHWIS